MNILRTCLITIISCFIMSCGGGGGGGDHSGSGNGHEGGSVADYVISDSKLRIYLPADVIYYSLNYSVTYSDSRDGSDSASSGELRWTIINDPDAFTFDQETFSLIAKFETVIDGFRELQRKLVFIQPTKENDPGNSGAFRVFREYDPLFVDHIGSMKWNCTNLDIKEDGNICYGLYYAPGEFSIGWHYDRVGKTSRTSSILAFLGMATADDYEDMDMNWEITAMEVVDTPMGTFEAYRMEMERLLSESNGFFPASHYTVATYWYHPTVGVVKARVVESRKYQGEDVPTVYTYDYAITGTTIVF